MARQDDGADVVFPSEDPLGPMKTMSKVPVTFDGFEVGDAILSADGKMVMIKLNDSGVGLEIQERLQAAPGSLSISPRRRT